MLEISVKIQDGEPTVVFPKGTIDVLSCDEFRNLPCLQSPKNDTIMQLADVHFMDSTGLSSLVQTIKDFRNVGLNFILSEPQSHVNNVLLMTSLDQIVPILPDLASAREHLESLRKE